MNQWRPVELISNYWIIFDIEYNEYKDQDGDNLIFETKKQAKQFIKSLLKQSNQPKQKG